MVIRNQIINYFASVDNGTPTVFRSAVTINASVALSLLTKQLKEEKKSLPTGKLFHVCFDFDSKIIYLPNSHEFPQNTRSLLLDAVKVKIANDFGEFSNRDPINGSPYTSLRIRTAESFPYSYTSLVEKIGLAPELVKSIPIIEVNLSRMPSTLKQLTPIYKLYKAFPGGYIGTGDPVVFMDEIDLNGKARQKPVHLLTQKPPFICVNISPEVQISIDKKEQTILNGFNDFINDKASEVFKSIGIDLTCLTVMQRAKHYLHLGFPFEEVCRVFLECVDNIKQFVNGGAILLQAVEELKNEGYNMNLFNYYITCRTKSNVESCDNFRVVESKNGFVIVETPIFMSVELCRKLLNADGNILIVQYNRAADKIDVKSQGCVYKDMKRSNFELVAKLYALSVIDSRKDREKIGMVFTEFRCDERSSGVSMSNNNIFNIRKISDYHYASDFIKKMFKDYGVEFSENKMDAITVLLGPIEQLMGSGTKGGFVDSAMWKKSGLSIPHEIVKGIFINPPLIAVDTVSMVSYAKQSDTLIHEFSHYLYNMTNPGYEPKYNKDPKLKDKDQNLYFYLYFSDANERMAHKYQIEFLLLSGMSTDEIVRDKVGGIVDESNYGIAMKFKEIVDEVIQKLGKS